MHVVREGGEGSIHKPGTPVFDGSPVPLDQDASTPVGHNAFEDCRHSVNALPPCVDVNPNDID